MVQPLHRLSGFCIPVVIHLAHIPSPLLCMNSCSSWPMYVAPHMGNVFFGTAILIVLFWRILNGYLDEVIYLWFLKRNAVE